MKHLTTGKGNYGWTVTERPFKESKDYGEAVMVTLSIFNIVVVDKRLCGVFINDNEIQGDRIDINIVRSAKGKDVDGLSFPIIDTRNKLWGANFINMIEFVNELMLNHVTDIAHEMDEGHCCNLIQWLSGMATFYTPINNHFYVADDVVDPEAYYLRL